MMKLPISVCIISGNEAHRIRRMLESVASWTSEIVVVLNEDSNDGTDKIAESFGARVFREPWKGHIAQKNSVAAKATQPWLLGLDADEEITPELHAEIRRVLAASTDFAAFRFPRCSHFCGRWILHGDWYPDYQTRLWQRGRAEWGGIDPHDKLYVQGKIGRLKGNLRHYSMESLDQQINKTMAYANDFVRHCQQQRKTVHCWELWLRPAWRFGRAYILRLGFLDGWQGFAIARVIAIYTFLRYLKAYQVQNETKTE